LPDQQGPSLLRQLADDFAPRDSLDYDDARDLLYSQIDNDNGIVTGVYTGYQIELNPNARPRSDALAKGINAEHVWPQSRGAIRAAKSDLHHLFPARIRVNSARGNNPFADIPDAQTRRWYRDRSETDSIPTADIDSYSEVFTGSFEPRESVKGNVARAMFYFYTMYANQADAAAPGFFSRQQRTLCQWHQNDPVDAVEVSRSRAIARSRQGNENPFVLDPSLAVRTYCARE
jgi:endonuclease I